MFLCKLFRTADLNLVVSKQLRFLIGCGRLSAFLLSPMDFRNKGFNNPGSCVCV